MGIHPFQIADLNWNFLQNNPPSTVAGSFASEFAVVPDNVNANLSRYMKLQAVWANVYLETSNSNPVNDSFGQPTGSNDTLGTVATPVRPNGGYFVRGLYFTGTAFPNNDFTGAFRVGYVGSFVGGLLHTDYAHDANGNPPTVDYEPIYTHATAVWPMTASAAKQWHDPQNPPIDTTDAVTNSGSALTRTAYMPASYMLMHIDSVGSNALSSGNVTFHAENRPTLKMTGFSDAIGETGFSPNWAGASIPSNGYPFAYPSDPLRGQGQLNTAATDNFHELYQVTGVRRLNSRGLSFHLAKYHDNGALCYAYPYEEDGITLGTGVSVIGNNIQSPYTYVNDQQEYVWAGGRDQGAAITATSVTSNVATFTAKNTFTAGQVVLIQGLGSHTEFNGALLVVLASGLSATQFEANWFHANYATAAETTGVAVAKPDFRIRQMATFIINEEYYGTVMDTKCAIWSNKSSMTPLVFFDLSDVTGWNAAAQRIAGVAVIPTYINATATLSWKVYFLSEGGKLAIYDFTQTNGVLALDTNAPAVAASGEAYGALRARSTTATITSTQVTGGTTLTVTCANDFEVGETVNLSGLTTSTFLNNQTVTVATASGTQFTASYAHANYGPTADTGTATAYALWAVYGTMSPDPRLTQTALANTARIGVIRYLPGNTTWGSVQFSPLTARHNGRSLQEMMVARDTKLYMLVEDVSVVGAGPFNVSNAFSNASVTSVSVTSNVATVQAVNTFVAGQTVFLFGFTSATFLNGQTVIVSATGLSGTQFEFNFTNANYGPTADSGTASAMTNVNWQVMAVDATIPTAVVWNNNGKINGTTKLQYGTNMGANGVAESDNTHYWFHAINAQLHDVATGKILIQPNWTAGSNTSGAGSSSIGFQVLDVSGSTSTLANANLTTVTRGTILPNDSQIPGSVDPAVGPVTVVHARDGVTNGDRTIFWLNDLNRANLDNWGLYLAPPGFNWGSVSPATLLPRNAHSGNPIQYTSFQKDYWSAGFMDRYNVGAFTQRAAWTFPTMLTDNYVHYVVGSPGDDGLPSGSTYGRSFGQGMGFLPTYWKFTGGNWKMADNWADAVANPKTIPNAGVNVSLPYGLQVQYGTTGASAYTQNEFQTFNMAWGNTKFARKMRQSYAQFAGQTFTNQETRTIANINAISMNLIDTDLGTVTNTAPTSATPQTATLTTPSNGYVTQTRWPKLDGVNSPFDTTPFTTVWNVNSGALDTTAFAFPPAANVSGSSPGPFTWTANAVTYAVQASGDNGNLAWFAVAGNPQVAWQSNLSGTGTVAVDLGSAKTVLTYSFRPVFNSSDVVDASTPKIWTIEGSNTSLTAGFTTIDTRNVTISTHGVAYTIASPASYRYYRFNITGVQGPGSPAPTLSMWRLNTSALQSSVNFSEMVFYAYGSQVSATYHYNFIRNWQMARGIKLETSTNNGVSYSPVFDDQTTPPLWRSLNGYVWTFPRQTGVTNVRITVRHGFNYNTGSNSGNVPATTAFGPFYFIDYGSQAVMDAARLGITGLTPPDPRAASFDPNCLGIATDVPNISIDGANPSLLYAQNVLVNTAVHGFWGFDWVADATHSDANHNNVAQFKVHPFFGFVLFQGAGGSGGVSTQTGTNAVINYQWGRRV